MLEQASVSVARMLCEGTDPTYVEERHGKNTSTNRNGFHRMRQWHDRQNYVYGKEIDKQLLAEYENSTTALLCESSERFSTG